MAIWRWAVLASTAVLLGACNGGGSSDGAAGDDDGNEVTALCADFTAPDGTAPQAVTTGDDLLCYLRSAMRASVGITDYTLGGSAGGGGGEFSPAPAAPGIGGDAVSGTNLQEVGVDEADRIKSDGGTLFLLETPTDDWMVPLTGVSAPGSQLRIMTLGANPPGAQEQVMLDLGASVDGLYLTDDAQLIAVGDGAANGSWYVPWEWQNGRTNVVFTDVTDPLNPVLGTQLQIEGYPVATRRIGDTLYLVTRHTPVVPSFNPYPSGAADHAANAVALAATDIEALLPDWWLDGVAQGDLYTPEECWLLPKDSEQALHPDLLAVTAIDLNAPTAPPVTSCVAGGSEAVYASTEALYAATTTQSYPWPSGEVVFIAPPITYPQPMTTEIHKFAFTEQGPAYRGSGSVEGHLGFEADKKSFRMGEHDDVLRVATSLGESWDASATTRLFVLRERDGTLETIAELPNDSHPEPIGKPGEQLYAARFLGERGYLVTFRVTDPLYVVDLSDPADPYLAGSLAIEGYSDYLHPVNDTTLLGVGKDAVPDASAPPAGRGAWYQGVKLALFDVSDPSAPTELDSLVLGGRGTESDVLYDHHAFAWLPASATQPARLALPVRLHASVNPDYPPHEPWDYYAWTRTGLHLFEIAGDAINASGEVVAEQAEGPYDYPDHYSYGSDRGLIAGDAVHFIHGNSVWSAPWDNPATAIGPQ